MISSKVLLFLVEGQSDEISLAPAMEKIVTSSTVKFKIMNCDIVCDYDSTPQNIEKRIKKQGVSKFLNANSQFTAKDICGIIHIVDLDGTFAPDSLVIPGNVQHAEYYDDKIICNDINKFLRGKINKRNNLLHLISLTEIKIPFGLKVPYSVYYMSCNIDHVLHNKRNATLKEKKVNSTLFGYNYDDPQNFENFFNRQDVKIDGTYSETWNYVQTENNSLKKGSNFWICINNCKDNYYK